MKLLILNAIKEWIVNKFGLEKWKLIAESSGLNYEKFSQGDSYYSDDKFLTLIQNMSQFLAKNQMDMINEFAEYYMTDFAPRIYQYFVKKYTTVKDVLIGILKLNNYMCHLLPNKYISKIDFQELNRTTITLIYPTESCLIDIVAVLRAVSGFYDDRYTIKKINPHSVQIIFEKNE